MVLFISDFLEFPASYAVQFQVKVVELKVEKTTKEEKLRETEVKIIDN